MKVIIFGVSNTVNDDEIVDAMSNLSQVLGTSVKVTILSQSDLLEGSLKPSPRNKSSKFVRATKTIHETCGDIVRNPGDRATFYDMVLKGKIEKPILEVLTFGPTCSADLEAIRDMGGKEFLNIARTALSLYESMNSNDGKNV